MRRRGSRLPPSPRSCWAGAASPIAAPRRLIALDRYDGFAGVHNLKRFLPDDAAVLTFGRKDTRSVPSSLRRSLVASGPQNLRRLDVKDQLSVRLVTGLEQRHNAVDVLTGTPNRWASHPIAGGLNQDGIAVIGRVVD